jgi:hypothetical protein
VDISGCESDPTVMNDVFDTIFLIIEYIASQLDTTTIFIYSILIILSIHQMGIFERKNHFNPADKVGPSLSHSSIEIKETDDE